MDHHDVKALPENHLIQAEVFEVAASRDVDVVVLVIRQPKRIPGELPKGQLGRNILVTLAAALARIAKPGAQANIEKCHDEGQYRRGVISHIRAGRGPGNGYRRSQGQAAVVFLSSP